MSIDREYAFRISTVARNSGAQQATRGVKEAGPGASPAADDLSIFETRGPELRDPLRGLNDVLPGVGQPLRAAVELKTPESSGMLSTLEKIKSGARAEGSVAPPEGQSRSLPELATANDDAFPQPANGSNDAGRDTVSPRATTDPGVDAQSGEFPVDAQTRTDLANQIRQFQKESQAQAPAMSRQDAVDLLAVIRQFGEAFFQQAQNSVTKQDFEREKIALRRLIESKGK